MASDKHVRRSGEDYTHAFLALLPDGQAWPKHEESWLYKTVRGLCEDWGFVDSRAADLLEKETDPRYTTEMMAEWERAFGLPDKCLSEPLTMSDRRKALMTKITMLGAQSREFFIALAASIGYHIVITEYRPWMVGIDRVGMTIDPYTGAQPAATLGYPENRFYWTVHVGQARLTWFRVTAGETGVDPHLRIGLATDLECLLNRYKPAHTQIIFDYSGSQTGDPMAGTP